MKKLLLIFLVFGNSLVFSQVGTSYQSPPKAILDIVLAPPTPGVNIDTKGEWMLLSERSDFPSINDLAEPELRIAGIRINPDNFGPSRFTSIIGFKLKNIKSGETFSIDGLPKQVKAGNVQWSPDEKQIAFIQITDNKITLWKIDVATKKATQVTTDAINAVLGSSYSWAGNDVIIYKATIHNSSKVPGKPKAPAGPIVQENMSKTATAPTFEDLIKNPYDEALFEFYATSQLKRSDGKTLGTPDIYGNINLSPDNRYILMERTRKPFSYLVTSFGFPKNIEILDANTGNTVKVLAQNPSSETNPIGLDNVIDYPRGYNWRNDEPATIYYVKAQDGGLRKNKAEFRDAVFILPAPFIGEPQLLAKTKMRYRGIVWGNASLALLMEGMSSVRRIRINRLNPANGEVDSLFERSTDDAYSDIGQPITKPNQYSQNVLLVLPGNQLMFRSQGSSPEGDLPYIQTFDLKSKKGKIIWRSQAPHYETVVSVLDPTKLIVITARESVTEPPNYYLRDLKKNKMVALTDFKDPQPALRQLTREKISYKRKDGVDLTAMLYLPAGYNREKDGKLPVIIWAYPREFKSANDAAQVRGSKHTFTRINYGSPVFWALQGYAVLDNAEMPIVSVGEKEPNDNFVEQLQMNAEAAINKVTEMGVGDPNRVAVGGHSYGAFMTANLLAHTNLFKAGIARSGAYNRTLTPFGFQNEERTYWQAPEVYDRMSPFMYANKIKTPLLMIHGEADNNSGTFPIQSERLYNAIKGHGGTVRFVVLPYESHGYAARENILHMLWEQDQWLEKWVKNTDSKVGEEKKKVF